MYSRIAVACETETVTMDDEIDILREPPNETEGLGKRRPALEEKFRMPVGQPVVERIEDKCNVSRRLAAASNTSRLSCSGRERKDSKASFIRQLPGRS